MSEPRAPTWVPWTACALILTTLNLVLQTLSAGTRSLEVQAPEGSGDPWLQALAGIAYLATVVVGSLILSCHPRHPIGWVCGLGGMGLAFAAFASEYPAYALFESTMSLPAPRAVAWLGSWMWWLAFGATMTFLFLLFPDGKLPSRRWRPVTVLATVNLVAVAAGHAFAPGLLAGEYAVTVNPVGIEAAGDFLEGLRSAGWVLLTFNLLVAVTALATRLVRARGDQRQQLKWLAYAASICALALPAWALSAPARSRCPSRSRCWRAWPSSPSQSAPASPSSDTACTTSTS